MKTTAGTPIAALAITVVVFAVIASEPTPPPSGEAVSKTTGETTVTEKIETPDEHWCAELTPEQYRILREKGTERAFTGEYYATKDAGTYRCAGCGTPLFDSETKFDSGTGWPSFYQKIGDNVSTESDRAHGMVRTEVLCAKCGGHLGHVFNDGPMPTGLRYCINSAALKLEKKAEENKEKPE